MGKDPLGPRLTTIVVDSRLLFREALESLMRSHSYDVLPGVGSAAEVSVESHAPDRAGLVILSAQSADTAIHNAAGVRKLWSDSKIVLLLEQGFSAHLDELLQSEIDAFVPLFVSAVTLMRSLELIVATVGRVVILSDRATSPISRTQEACRRPRLVNPLHAEVSEAASIARTMAPGTQPAALAASASGADFSEKAIPKVSRLRILPDLSEREVQILNSLVRGHANKVIARRCGITEATVKVHIRSILRKIRVGNRTQAAIWAIETGYCVDEPPKSH